MNCPVADFERLPVIAELELRFAKRDHGIECQVFRMLSLHIQPFRPGLLLESDVGKEGSRIELNGRTEGLPAPIGKQGFKSRNIGRDDARLEGDGFSPGDERIVAQNAPQPREGLAKVLPRLAIEVRAPQKRHELVAAVGSRGRAGQEGQQGYQFSAGKVDAALRPAQFEPAEKRQLKFGRWHGVHTRPVGNPA
jgi:hypothetical protein